jgi:hypothetical protein
MPALISAELLRLRTVRSSGYYVLGVLAVLVIVTAQNVDPGAGGPGSSAEQVDALRSLALTGVLFAGVLAAIKVGTDFQRGWAARTYLNDPHRARVSAARALTYAGIGYVFAGLAAGVVVAVGLAVAGGGVSAGDVTRIVAGAAFGGAVLGAAGTLLGTACRNPTIASSAVFGWNLVETMVVPAGARPYMPLDLIDALMGGTGDVPPPAAIGLVLAYLALAALVVRTWALDRDLT